MFGSIGGRRIMARTSSPDDFILMGQMWFSVHGSDLLSPLLAYLLPISPVFLYNIWVVLLLVLGGMGIRRLVCDIGGSNEGAFAGGIPL